MISAVTPELQLVSVISTLPRMSTVPEAGAVQDRATNDDEVGGGTSSKLLMNPGLDPLICHSWSSVLTVTHVLKFVQVEPFVLDWYDQPLAPWVVQLNPFAPYETSPGGTYIVVVRLRKSLKIGEGMHFLEAAR